MRTIELDTVVDAAAPYGPTAEDAGRAIVEGYDGVTFTVVTEHGPAGGNPILRFEGEEDALRAMVRAHYGPDAEDVFQ